MTRLSRRRFVAAVGAASLAGCGGLQGSVGDPSGDGENDESDGGASGPPTAEDRLPLPMAPEQLREAARSGGPDKDGIPSIDEPSFVDASAVDFLQPGEPVFGVARDGAVKAYPQTILVHHEIVNDRLGETPVSVTYCPLTGTVQGFERGETTFGVSGRLINANLVMYDRATDAWWPQMLATAIPGPWNGDPGVRSIREFRVIWTTWEQWRTEHPDTRVLSTETGHARNYQDDPYGTYAPRSGYYERDRLLYPPLEEDDRYAEKEVVLGARTPEGAVAFHKDGLRGSKLRRGVIGDRSVLAVYDPRYDTGYVYRDPAEGSYEHVDGEVRAPDGTMTQPDAVDLSRIHTFDAMWFAWAGYYPETNVYA